MAIQKTIKGLQQFFFMFLESGVWGDSDGRKKRRKVDNNGNRNAMYTGVGYLANVNLYGAETFYFPFTFTLHFTFIAFCVWCSVRRKMQ